MTTLKKIHVKVVSDIACPYCFLGYKRLQKAIKETKAEFTVEFEPFLLNPKTPPKLTLGEYLQEKFGTANIDKLPGVRNLIRGGEDEGIQFNFSPDKMVGSTVRGHALCEAILEKGKASLQCQVMEELFKMYQEKGESIWEESKLEKLAKLADLDLEFVLKHFESKVRQKDRMYKKMGISGVPFFIVNDQFAISGAQEPQAFIKTFEKI